MMAAMSRVTRILCAGTTALTILTGPVWAESLGDALVSAYKTSDLLAQNQAVLRAADEDVAGAVATLRPVVSWALEGKRTKNITVSGYATSNTASLNFDWQLLDFGRGRLGVALAKESVLATRQALVGVEQNVFLQAVTAYMDVRRATQTVDIAASAVNVINEQLKATQDRFDLGEATATDVAQAEARLAATQAKLAAARGQLEVAKATYVASIGHEWDGKSALPATPALPKTLDEAKSIAQRLHPAILQAQHQAKVADLQVELAAAERRPTLDAGLSVGQTEFGTSTGVGTLQLSQPIYTGGKLSSVHRKAIAGRDAARAALTHMGVAVTEQVTSAWTMVDVTRAQIKAMGSQVEAARSAYEGVKEQANLGEATTLDVLDAERELDSARADLVSAEADQQVALYSVLAAMGLLTADHLNLGIPTFDPEAYYNAVKAAPVTSTRGASLDRVLKAIGKE